MGNRGQEKKEAFKRLLSVILQSGSHSSAEIHTYLDKLDAGQRETLESFIIKHSELRKALKARGPSAKHQLVKEYCQVRRLG